MSKARIKRMALIPMCISVLLGLTAVEATAQSQTSKASWQSLGSKDNLIIRFKRNIDIAGYRSIWVRTDYLKPEDFHKNMPVYMNMALFEVDCQNVSVRIVSATSYGDHSLDKPFITSNDVGAWAFAVPGSIADRLVNISCM